MLFNSLDFAVFLPIVFAFYWFVFQKNLRIQNALIVVASYIFYGWWDWRFLTLIFFSTLVDYSIGIALKANDKPNIRKHLLWTSIAINLGLLGFFKYYNFFLDNFIDAFSLFGMNFNASSLNLILPVGISFYTFQTLSYTIDVYKRKLDPTSDFISFSAFVSFFPQLVAGPIERATNLLPQFYKKRKFDYKQTVSGLRQILWGLFKKIVIADTCGKLANEIFNNSADYNGSTLILGALYFAFQIYGDFSGYSDIAIGTSRLFGFNLMQNFAFPYFSRDIAEFWRRWHISLSTWFRDYIYIPLGGSKVGSIKKVRNVFIIFIVSGFWHGANWTFIIWGALNALYFLPLMFFNKNRTNLNVVSPNSLFPSIKDFIRISRTFTLVVLTWIFFRAESVTHATSYLQEIFSPSLFETPQHFSFYVFVFIGIMMLLEWIGRKDLFAIEKSILKLKTVPRFAFYYCLAISIYWFGGEEQSFIYFQF